MHQREIKRERDTYTKSERDSMYLLQLLAAAWLSLAWLSSCQGFGQFHMKRYQLQRGYNPDDSSENDNSVLRKSSLHMEYLNPSVISLSLSLRRLLSPLHVGAVKVPAAPACSAQPLLEPVLREQPDHAALQVYFRSGKNV